MTRWQWCILYIVHTRGSSSVLRPPYVQWTMARVLYLPKMTMVRFDWNSNIDSIVFDIIIIRFHELDTSVTCFCVCCICNECTDINDVYSLVCILSASWFPLFASWLLFKISPRSVCLFPFNSRMLNSWMHWLPRFVWCIRNDCVVLNSWTWT